MEGGISVKSGIMAGVLSAALLGGAFFMATAPRTPEKAPEKPALEERLQEKSAGLQFENAVPCPLFLQEEIQSAYNNGKIEILKKEIGSFDVDGNPNNNEKTYEWGKLLHKSNYLYTSIIDGQVVYIHNQNSKARYDILWWDGTEGPFEYDHTNKGWILQK